MRWMVVLAACGGGSGGGGGNDAGEPMATCEMSIEITGDRTASLAATSCGGGAPGHIMLFGFDDDGSSVVTTQVQLSTPSIALGPQAGTFEFIERRSGGEFISWTNDECAFDFTTSELLGEVDLAGNKRQLFQVAGTASCGVATMGTSELMAAPFSFMAGAVE